MSGARCLKCFALRPHLHVPKTGKCMRCKRPERMPEPSTQGRLAKPRCGVAEPVLKHPPRQWQDHSCNGRAAMDGRGRTREVRRFLYVRLGPKAPLQAIGAPVGHSKASKIKTTQKLPRSSVYVEVCGIHVTESLQNASSECGRGSHFHPRLFFNSRPAKLLRVLGCFAAQYAGRLRRERTSSARGVGR